MSTISMYAFLHPDSMFYIKYVHFYFIYQLTCNRSISSYCGVLLLNVLPGGTSVTGLVFYKECMSVLIHLSCERVYKSKTDNKYQIIDLKNKSDHYKILRIRHIKIFLEECVQEYECPRSVFAIFQVKKGQTYGTVKDLLFKFKLCQGVVVLSIVYEFHKIWMKKT